LNAASYSILIYALFWVARLNGCIRRGRQPLLRGTQWCFDVRVQPDFYVGAGKAILHRYWMRMLIPFAVDIPIAIAIFMSGRLMLLNLLIIGLCALVHLNHSFSVDLAERQARPFAAPEANEPVARLSLSLTPRRLRSYTHPLLEWALALSNGAAIAWLIHIHGADWRVPAFLIYAQLGVLFAKYLIVTWRSPLPQDQAAEQMEAREERRRFHTRMCDWARAAMTLGFVFRSFVLSASQPGPSPVVTAWLAAWMAIAVASGVWVEIRRKQLTTLALRVSPRRLPDFLRQSEIARWPVCYQPSAPLLILKGAHGYSINFANALAWLAAAWLSGLIVLIALLPL
jgi:hypothetical protein